VSDILIKADIFEAASLCMSKNKIRYYLEGIHLGGGRLTATDGHRIFTADQETGEELIIPAWVVKIAMKDIKNAGSVILRGHELIVGDKGFWFTPIDAAYPDYKRAIPAEMGEEKAAHFDPKYYADLGKMAKILTGSTTGFDIKHNGEAPCGVLFGDREDCLAVIMPVRQNNRRVWKGLRTAP